MQLHRCDVAFTEHVRLSSLRLSFLRQPHGSRVSGDVTLSQTLGRNWPSTRGSISTLDGARCRMGEYTSEPYVGMQP
jgi:hypothetical protein